MTPYYADESVTVHHGDCLDVMRGIPDNSVDAVVTDPPYGLGFMGKSWDNAAALHRPPSAEAGDTPLARFRTGKGPAAVAFDGIAFQQWCEQWAAECLRILKPGGHMLAFGGTRTWHRLTCAVEDAGFEVRDSIAWLYGSGFPKSLDVSKAIDKAAGADREIVAPNPHSSPGRKPGVMGMSGANPRPLMEARMQNLGIDKTPVTAPATPATPAAQQWQGWGTALKPAFEPVVVARKPLAGTVAGNVTTWGTGALNIDGCRVGMSDADREIVDKRSGADDGKRDGIYEDGVGWRAPGERFTSAPAGRWPSNVVLDGDAAAELDRQSGTSRDEVAVNRNRTERKPSDVGYTSTRVLSEDVTYGDSGGASRFFPVFRYEPKAPTAERPSYERDGAGTGRVTGLGGKVRQCNVCETRAIESGASEPSCGHGDYRWEQPTRDSATRVAHPTVKPLDLMRWLVRLVTPPGGTVLEPFAGSGTTAEACVIEGFRCIAIEREADYLPLIRARLSKPIQPDLFGGGAA